MSPKVYFDTSVWIAPYDGWRSEDTVLAIEEIIDAHKKGELQLYISCQIEGELSKLLLDSRKSSKAAKALQRLKSLNLPKLPFTPAIIGRAVIGEARIGQGTSFDGASLKNQDKQVAEFMTANNIDFFVTVDSDFLKIKPEIEARLRRERTSVVTPEDLLKEIGRI